MACAVFIAVWDDVKYRARLVRPAQQANPSSFTAGHFPLARQNRVERSSSVTHWVSTECRWRFAVLIAASHADFGGVRAIVQRHSSAALDINK